MSAKDDLITNLTSNGFISESAPLTGGVDLLLDGIASVMDAGASRAALIARMYANLTCGGSITFTAEKYLSWAPRFILIGLGRGSHFSTNGFFDVKVPAAGVLVQGHGGAADVATTADGIYIEPWTALYYELPFGSNSNSIQTNFRLVKYVSDYQVPDDWLLLATRNNDIQTTLRTATGVLLQPGQQWTPTGGVVNI